MLVHKAYITVSRNILIKEVHAYLVRKSLADSVKKRKEEGLNPVIAEIKVFSPKYGDLLRGRSIFQILKIYESCGVSGISYITEKKHFRGDFEVFREICREASLPVLRKDFVTSKEEIEKTAEAEASAILLIASILREKTAEFVDYSHEHGLETVVEVHRIEDVNVANQTKSDFVGINNRDIFLLEKDDGSVEVTKRLAKFVKSSFLKISESGIRDVEDLKVALSFCDAALVGTAFMLAENLEEVVRKFVGVGYA